MSLTVEAVYENGVLKPAEPLPLREHEKVRVTVLTEVNWATRTYGMLGWKGDPETLRRIAEDEEFGILGVAMTLANIPNGTSVFVDAMNFVYHLGPDPVYGPPCQQFFDRIDRQEIVAFASTHELSDAAHRLMTIEAMALFGWPAAGVAQHLRRHPSEIQKLTKFRAAVEELHRSKVQFLPVTPALVVSAAIVSQQHGLLSGDALIVALMQAKGLTNLASNDADFDRVPGITRYAPA